MSSEVKVQRIEVLMDFSFFVIDLEKRTIAPRLEEPREFFIQLFTSIN